MFTPEQIKELQAPLDKSVVKTRKQAGQELSYVEAWHCENEANRIFGFAAWDRFSEVEYIDAREQDGKWRVYYRAKVRFVVRSDGGEVTIREGHGFGSGIDRDIGQAHESALKEAESDAEKRAMKTFGNPFGQALYDKTQANVQAAPPPPPPEESSLYIACKAAMDMAVEQEGKAGLERWAANNKQSMANMERDYPAIYQAVRKLYAKKLHDFTAVKEAA